MDHINVRPKADE